MVKIAVLASFNMDLVMRVERRPDAGETLLGDFAMHLGGKGFNQAVAARRLGTEVAVTGRVGDDEFGRAFLSALDDEGIDRRAVVVDPSAGTGVATIYVEPDGTNSIVQAPRANRNVSYADFARSRGSIRIGEAESDGFIAELRHPELFEGAHVSLTNFETDDDAAAQFQLQMWTRNKPQWTMLNAAPARSVSAELLERSAIVVVNELEAATIAGMSKVDASDVPAARDRIGCTLLVVTFGERGSAASKPGSRVEAPAFHASVVDTTGAGDAFCGAFAVKLTEGAELEDAMRFANAAGAVACTRHGAYESMPSRDEVEALMREEGSSR